MNCAEYKELLVAYVEGLLDETEKRSVAQHLKDCTVCRAELKETSDLRSRLVNNGKNLAQTNLEDVVLERIIREQNIRLKAASKIGASLNVRRIIIKSRITKFAAAAAIIVATVLGLHFFSPFRATVTFADVIKPILNARTVVLDYVIGEGPDALEIHDIVIGSRIRRTISNMDMTTILDSRVRSTLSNMDMTMILDLEDARMLTLVSLGVTKIASYVDIQGTGQEGTRSVLDFVRNVVSEVKDNPDADIQDLGEKEINGQKAVGFYVKGLSSIELTIWANKKTSLPIRIEFTEGKTLHRHKEHRVRCPPGRVPRQHGSPRRLHPEGHLHPIEDTAPDNLPEEQLDLSNATEEDLVESLRIWAEIILDGAFPDAIGTDHFMKQAAVLGYKLASLGLPVSEMEQWSKYTKGMIFLQEFEFGGKWGYAGKGVKLGDADKIILWYQPENSQNWRVIYGDFER